MAEKIFYPITEESLHRYAKSIFTPIKRGESVATIWIPMSGRRKHNKFLIENIELFKKELPNFEECVLVYVESLELPEESIELAQNIKSIGFYKIPVVSKNKKGEVEVVVEAG